MSRPSLSVVELSLDTGERRWGVAKRRCFDRAGLLSLKAPIFGLSFGHRFVPLLRFDDWEGSPPALANIGFTAGFVQPREKTDNVSRDKLAMFPWLFSV
jgi:hypothetical protein